MGSTRRSFTDEYKTEAVNFVIEGNRSTAEVARNIGVHEMTLGKWVKKEREARSAAVPAEAPLTESERLELIRLRAEVKDKDAENAELRMQVAFAKKVALGSMGRCSSHQLTHFRARCHELQRLPRACVQLERYGIQIVLRVTRQITPFREYCRSSPLVFSFVPRCQGECGSAKNTLTPVETVKR